GKGSTNRTGSKALQPNTGLDCGNSIALTAAADCHKRVEELIEDALAACAFACSQRLVEFHRQARNKVENRRGIRGEARAEISFGEEFRRWHTAEIGQPVAHLCRNLANQTDVADAILETDEVRAGIAKAGQRVSLKNRIVTGIE